MATTVSAEMVVPVFLGYWVDQWLGTTAVFALIGAATGLFVGIWNLIRLTKALGSGPEVRGSGPEVRGSGPRDKSRKQ